jgi:predicted amidophosphoribosyltransferase
MKRTTIQWLSRIFLRPPVCSHCGLPATPLTAGLCWGCADLLARRAAIDAKCPCGNPADAMISHHPVCRGCVQALNRTVGALRLRGLTTRQIIRYLVEAGRDAEAEILLKKYEEEPNRCR